jgi:pyruvate ferredoxin oxidoreductase beta subunit
LKLSLVENETCSALSDIFCIPAGVSLPKTIVAAHGIDYAATASVGYIQDFLNKINKAKSVDGTSYIHVFAPCPTGWGMPTDSAIDIGKEVVDCGLWYLAEYEGGEFVLNRNPKGFAPVRDYLSKQGRFKHLKDEDVEQITRERDRKWGIIRKRWRIE